MVKMLQESFAEWYTSCKDSFEGKEYGTASLEKVKQKWPVFGVEKDKKRIRQP